MVSEQVNLNEAMHTEQIVWYYLTTQNLTFVNEIHSLQLGMSSLNSLGVNCHQCVSTQCSRPSCIVPRSE